MINNNTIDQKQHEKHLCDEKSIEIRNETEMTPAVEDLVLKGVSGGFGMGNYKYCSNCGSERLMFSLYYYYCLDCRKRFDH